MKAFTKLSEAKKFNKNNAPMVIVGNLYVVGIKSNTCVSVVDADALTVAVRIGVKDLSELGEAPSKAERIRSIEEITRDMALHTQKINKQSFAQ